MKKIVCAFLLILGFNSYSQNISGIVLDNKTKQPIEGVNVYIKLHNIGTSTNKKGAFSIRFSNNIAETDSIQFSIIGYKKKTLSYSQLKKQLYDVYLSPQIEHLDQVLISTDKSLQPRIKYKKLTPLKKGAYSTAATLLNNRIYVVGGDISFKENPALEALDNALTYRDFKTKLRSDMSSQKFTNAIQVYHINNDEWKLESNISIDNRAYHNVNTFNGKLYVLGGKYISRSRGKEYLHNKIEIIDIEEESVLVDEVNPHQAVNFGSFTYNDNIIVMGGSIKKKRNGKKVYSNKSYIYNLGTGFWYSLQDMTKAKEANGVIIENKIYLIGGFNGIALSEIESYNLTTGEWKNEGDFFEGINTASIVADNDVIYIYTNKKIYSYNTMSNILNEYDIDLNIYSPNLLCYDDTLYVIGGYKKNKYTKTSSRQLYSVSLGEFKKTRVIQSKKL